MVSRRDVLRLATALPLAVGVGAAPRPARACSCHGYGRSSALPASGVTGVDPRTALVFSTYGYAALRAEARGAFRYWLESGSSRRVPLRREQLGNLVRLTPLEPLAPDTEYGLRTEQTEEARLSRADADGWLTHFRTGPRRPLPPLVEPRLRRIRRRAPLLSSSWCAGRSYQAEFRFDAPAIAPADAGLFRWELSYWDRRADAWTPLQGAPVHTNTYRDTPTAPTESLTVGREQCTSRPVFPLRARRVTLSLVRVDGERRSITGRFR